MKIKVSRIAATGAVVGLLAVGGAGYAYAQSSDSSPSPSTTTPGNGSSTDNGGNAGGHDPANCPNMGGDNGATSSSYSRTV